MKYKIASDVTNNISSPFIYAKTLYSLHYMFLVMYLPGKINHNITTGKILLVSVNTFVLFIGSKRVYYSTTYFVSNNSSSSMNF